MECGRKKRKMKGSKWLQNYIASAGLCRKVWQSGLKKGILYKDL
jgi:hypothetical protein